MGNSGRELTNHRQLAGLDQLVLGLAQGAFGALANAVTGGDPEAIKKAVDAANAISRARNPDIPKSEGGGGPERIGSAGMGGDVNDYLSGVITDPVATGQAVAAALNSASRTTGPLLLAGTVQ